MYKRRTVLRLLPACLVVTACGGVHAQGKATPTEASLRKAIDAYVATWNRHDVKAWAEILTEDVWYHEADDYYKRMKGRPAVLSFYGDLVKLSDLKWEIKRIKFMPDGTASVLLSHHALILPKSKGKYASSFESTPSFTRWRIEGDRWRMFYFTSDKGSALVAMQKDGLE